MPIDWLPLLITVGLFLFGYLLGSIPFGVILTRIAGTEDLRRIGSGNIGATNVLRTGHKGLAAATLLGDLLKGTVAVLAARWIDGPDLPLAAGLVAGLGAFLGHLFPVWLGFKGGKGVATYIGILLALAWPTAIAFCLIWLLIAALTRYSSLAGLVASAATPGVLWFGGHTHEAMLFVLLTAMLWLKHRENVRRLLNGTEGKLGRRAEGTQAAK
jgi:glycerol-3-phosphate acyltransferase PlsY